MCACNAHSSRVPCRLLKIWIMSTSLKTFCLGDMASFACHDDRGTWLSIDKNMVTVLDTITNDLVYEPLARNGEYLK